MRVDRPAALVAPGSARGVEVAALLREDVDGRRIQIAVPDAPVMAEEDSVTSRRGGGKGGQRDAGVEKEDSAMPRYVGELPSHSLAAPVCALHLPHVANVGRQLLAAVLRRRLNGRV